jgi:hypothetical protein
MTLTALRRAAAAVLLVSLLIAGSSPALAQDSPWSLEAQLGGAVGAYEPAQSGVSISPSLSVRLNGSYAFADAWAVYAGFERSAFGCSGGFCSGGDVSFAATGGAFGVRYGATGGDGFFSRLGVVYQQLSTSATNFSETSNAGIGGEIETGYAIAVSPRVSIVPSLRYTRFAVDSDGSTNAVVVIATTVGARYRF